jgi:hypothetical protein
LEPLISSPFLLCAAEFRVSVCLSFFTISFLPRASECGISWLRRFFDGGSI